MPVCIVDYKSRMSIAYQISPSGHHIQVVGSGRVTTQGIIRVIRRIFSDPLFHPDSTALIDLHEAVYLYKNDRDVMKVALALEKNKTLLGNRIAIVAKQATLFPAEVLSLYMRTTTHARIRVFISLAAAMRYCKRGWSPSLWKQGSRHRK